MPNEITVNNEQRLYHGLVVALQANFYRVRLNQVGFNGVNELLCVCRTRLIQRGERICVGDQVEVEAVDWKEQRAAVVSIAPRSSILERPKVANCSRILVVIALTQPDIDSNQLSRFLLSAESTNLPISVIFNKSDLVDPCFANEWQQRVNEWGYDSFIVSSQTKLGLEKLSHSLDTSYISVICGPSGVGKTSIINALIPTLNLRVGSVSGRLKKGRHTTRHVQLFCIGHKGMVADTPGFNRPSIPKDPKRLGWLFPEIRNILTNKACRFRNCFHRGELGCSVGTRWDRYAFYNQSLEDLLATKDITDIS